MFCRKAVLKYSRNFHENTRFSVNLRKIFKIFFYRIPLDDFFLEETIENNLKNSLSNSTMHIFSENFKSLWQNLQRSGGKKYPNVVKNWLKFALLDSFVSWETIKTFSNNILVQTTEKYAINSVWLKFQLCEANISHVISINLLTGRIKKWWNFWFMNVKGMY